MKSLREFARRSVSLDMKLTVVTYRNAPEDTRSGMLSKMHYKCFPKISRSSRWTADGETHFIDGWDLIIAHPPCTYLSSVTTRHLSLKCTPAEKVIDRMWKLAESAVFFMQFALADCDKVCVENPLGFISRLWRKPDQTIHPYYFAESPNDKENYHKKRTCLWLKGLQPLKYNIDFAAPKPIGYSPNGKAYNFEEMATGQNRAKTRSKTFPGIAKAMAEQWGVEET